jgi:hypothetical protein
MASKLLLAEQRVALDAIDRLARRDLAQLWRAIDLTDARTATSVLLAEVPTLTTMYGDMAATLSADLYNEIRAEARPPGRFSARPAATASRTQVDPLVRWSVTPVWAEEPNAAAAFQRLAGGVTRLSLRPAGETFIESARRDPAKPKWARTTHPGACAFCLMLASRGSVYTSNAPYFESHDYCRCSAVQVYRGQEDPEDNQRLSVEWGEAVGDSRGDEALKKWRSHVDGLPDSERGSLLGPLLPV